LRFATVAVIGPGWLLSSNKILPMLGTLAHALSRAASRLISTRFYSYRRAIIGSTRDARRAGIQAASKATLRSTKPEPARVKGS
jgi:hypothetical protein